MMVCRHRKALRLKSFSPLLGRGTVAPTYVAYATAIPLYNNKHKRLKAYKEVGRAAYFVPQR